MRAYFLLEDQKSFRLVLPHWLSYAVPTMKEARGMLDFVDGTYIIESGYGYPRIHNVLRERLAYFVELDCAPDMLVICTDTDERDKVGISDLERRFENEIMTSGIDCDYRIICINCSFETWLLGNKAVYPTSIDSGFRDYADFYNVSVADPEQMQKPLAAQSTRALYHLAYLRAMLRSTGKHYAKGRPNIASGSDYWQSLVTRTVTTTDLKTFSQLLEVVDLLADHPV